MHRYREFDFGQDTFDSRDVIERIDYLESAGRLGFEERKELKKLKAFEAEATPSVADWRYGEIFIREDYFRRYAEELAEEIGALEKSDQWPNRCIDWEQAADELRQDYTEFLLAGTTYYARS